MAAPTGPIQLIGTIESSLGVPFNGAFLLQLNTYGSVLPSAGGGKYIGVSPTTVVRVPVINGQVQASPQIYVWGNDAMQGNTWYIVKQIDSNGNILMTINVLIVGSSPYDLGSMQPYQTAGLPSYLAIGQLLGQPGPPLVPYGAWSSTVNYPAGAVVSNGGQSFISLQAGNIGYPPTLAGSAPFWMLLANGYQLNEYIASITFTGVQTMVVTHGLNTLTPIIQAFVASGTTQYTANVIDANNIQLKWFGAAVVQLLVATPSEFINTAASYNASALPTGGLVAHWPMNEGSGSTFYNTQNSANNITATGVTWADLPGTSQLAPTFADGSSAVAAVVDPLADFDGSKPFCVSMWIENNAPDTHIRNLLTGLFPGGIANQNTTGFNWTIQGATGSLVRNFSTPATVGTLYHIVWMYDGSKSAGAVSSLTGLFRYVNGAADNNTFGPTTSNLTVTQFSATPVTLGGAASGGFVGKIAGLRVYNRMLQAFEITQLYQAGPAGV